MGEPSLTTPAESNGYLADVARWLADCGYPYDWSSDHLPPVALRGAIEDEWVRRDDDGDPETEAVIRYNTAEQGGWLQAARAVRAAPSSTQGSV